LNPLSLYRSRTASGKAGRETILNETNGAGFLPSPLLCGTPKGR
jgi:hypothetical protein